MTAADMINGGFEALGTVFVLNHCRVLLKDRQVKGVSILSTVFFTGWGFWNLYFYPSLGQWWSFVGAALLVGANCLYVALLVVFRFQIEKPFYPVAQQRKQEGL